MNDEADILIEAMKSYLEAIPNASLQEFYDQVPELQAMYRELVSYEGVDKSDE